VNVNIPVDEYISGKSKTILPFIVYNDKEAVPGIDCIVTAIRPAEIITSAIKCCSK